LQKTSDSLSVFCIELFASKRYEPAGSDSDPRVATFQVPMSTASFFGTMTE
jgi:hypothetical protein